MGGLGLGLAVATCWWLLPTALMACSGPEVPGQGAARVVPLPGSRAASVPGSRYVPGAPAMAVAPVCARPMLAFPLPLRPLDRGPLESRMH